jgi:hypothetical protein
LHDELPTIAGIARQGKIILIPSGVRGRIRCATFGTRIAGSGRLRVNVLQFSQAAYAEHRDHDETEECDEGDRQDQRLTALSGAATMQRVI